VPKTAAVVKGKAAVTVPGYGVVTVVGKGTSQSVFADGLAPGWSAKAGVETSSVTHWQSERALSLASGHRDATLQLVNPAGAMLRENDLLEFYVRPPERSATLEKIGFRFAGSKHLVTAKHSDLYLDDEPVRGRKLSVPNDGAWHKVTVDLDGLRPRRGASLTAFEIQADGRQQIVVDDVVLRSL
jgi:hypothetical protein